VPGQTAAETRTTVRLLLCLYAGWCVSASAQIPDAPKAPLAALTVTSDRPIRVRAFKKHSYIHTNRHYAFRELPSWMLGLPYTLHQHKNTGTLTCQVTAAGHLYLLLGMKAKPLPVKEGPEWVQAGTMAGADGGGLREWEVYVTRVEAGATFPVRSPNKWGAVLVAGELTAQKQQREGDTALHEYRYLQGKLTKRPDKQRRELVARQAFHPQATILDSDRDPLDVVLRRTRALLGDLSQTPNGPGLAAERVKLDNLRNATRTTPVGDAKARQKLFDHACALRRKIAFANPLLDFDRITFLTHHRSRRNHMCDQYFGFNAMPDGGLYVLKDPFGPKPRVVNLLENARIAEGRLKGKALEDGSFISLDVAFDAQSLLFAWTEARPEIGKWKPETTYHIFRCDADGSNLTQLTDGPYNDFDPCWLPNGKIVFISDRRGGFGRCHGRPVPTYTLHAMNADGSDLHPLSLHETNEWHPSVDNNGMIVYTRWDYVDRDSDVAHHIWLTFPDGRDPRSYHGNYPLNRHARPWMEMSLRAIPGSHRYMGVAAPHHGQAYGSLITIDHRPYDDGYMSQVRRFTPETDFPESERSRPTLYATPWPLSETYALCAFDWTGAHHGIYLVDAFGNRELIYEDDETPCLDPIPLRPRAVPPTIPSMVPPPVAGPKSDAVPTGQVAIMDVRRGEFPFPGGVQPTSLRIVQLFPKATQAANRPNIGAGAQALARGVLGTVPIESDGSAYFRMPANIPVYFQVLDKRGVAIQTMRSDTYVHAGEQLTCLGCHEPKRMAPPPTTRSVPLALQREPSVIQSEFPEANPLTFPRLVQPVLDRQCVGCHRKSKGKAPDLRGDTFGKNGWSVAFSSLRKYAWARSGGNGAIKGNGGSMSIPGKVGASDSRLFKLLDNGHHKVALKPDELRRITLWLDCNSNFYGAYHDIEAQARGERVLPTVW
jgi:hypothetical protein